MYKFTQSSLSLELTVQSNTFEGNNTETQQSLLMIIYLSFLQPYQTFVALVDPAVPIFLTCDFTPQNLL